MEPAPVEIDLEALGLRSGQADAIELRLRPAPPVLAGETLALAGEAVPARVEVSRTTTGYALRLLARAAVLAPCFRCLETTELPLAIDAREVEQRQSGDAELTTPYVRDGVLDPTAWLHDAIALSLPEKLLCRPDCAGLCPECGVSLNDVDPAEHVHERPLDPRFAKLRELGDDS